MADKIKGFYGNMLRYLSYRRFKGKGLCPCCNNRVDYYNPYGTKKMRMNAECPECRGAERDRVEALYLKTFKFNENLKILHFAPEKWLYNYLTELNIKEYYPVDIDGDMPLIRKCVDITNIPFEEDYFDMIICNMVLEHVIDADKGMQELARVLKPSGECLITVPINEKRTTLQKEEINSDKLRIKYYGEANHVRMYGNDFKEILQRNGLIGNKVFAKDLDGNLHENGLRRNEYFWICQKSNRSI